MMKPLVYAVLLPFLLVACAGPDARKGNTVSDPKPKPKVNLRFLYTFCRDVAAVRRFYTEGLGMQEQCVSEQWVCYECEGMQLMFFKDEDFPAVRKTFSAQPGGGGGQDPTPSWSILIPEADFADTVGRLQALKAPANMASPKFLQDSYWSYVVLDPAGNTVEVYTELKQKPASTEWPGR